MDAHDTDTDHMRVALDLAVRGWGHVSPNPMVGALVLAGDEVVGRGWYEGPSGAPHAEVRALREAGDRARGATIVCTLEPCNHHGATPPCTEALIDAGVARVVVGATDPDPLVDGRGLPRLRAAGLDVRDGVLAAEAHRLNAAFERHVTTGTPFVIWKMATSLDGKTAARDGSSRWITSDEARSDVQRLRAWADAIVVGAGTVIADDPALTARHPDLPDGPAAAPRRGGRRRPCAGDRSGVRRERAHARRDDRRRRASPRARASGRGRGRGVRSPTDRRRRAGGPARRSSGSATCRVSCWRAVRPSRGASSATAPWTGSCSTWRPA